MFPKYDYFIGKQDVFTPKQILKVQAGCSVRQELYLKQNLKKPRQDVEAFLILTSDRDDGCNDRRCMRSRSCKTAKVTQFVYIVRFGLQ